VVSAAINGKRVTVQRSVTAQQRRRDTAIFGLKVPSMRLDLVVPAAEKITLVLEGIGDDKIPSMRLDLVVLGRREDHPRPRRDRRRRGFDEFVEFGSPFGRSAPTQAIEIVAIAMPANLSEIDDGGGVEC
jgi:hypothetical protein